MHKKFFKLFDDIVNQHENEKSVNQNDSILIVDFLNTFLRSFTGSPKMNEDGEHCGGISGSLYSIGNAIRLCKATRCIIIADGKDSGSRRRKIYPEYKQKRHMTLNLNRAYDFKTEQEEQEAMAKQLLRLISYINKLPVQFISIDQTEADDVIAYIATEVYNKPENKITVMSSDKDFLQLVNDRISVWSPTKKKLYTSDKVIEDFAISPENFVMYRSLIGDDSDNISGVEGIGPKKFKTDLQILQEQRIIDTDELLEYIQKSIEVRKEEKKKPLQYQLKILESKDLLELNKKLMLLDGSLLSGSIKMKINNLLDQKIPSLNKMELQLMSINDKLGTAMPNFSKWVIETFSLLNSFTTRKK